MGTIDSLMQKLGENKYLRNTIVALSAAVPLTLSQPAFAQDKPEIVFVPGIQTYIGNEAFQSWEVDDKEYLGKWVDQNGNQFRERLELYDYYAKVAEDQDGNLRRILHKCPEPAYVIHFLDDGSFKKISTEYNPNAENCDVK